MAAWLKIITMALRIAQLICAVIMVGVASYYIRGLESEGLGHISRFIFTDVVAVISAFFAFIWLIPFSSNYMNWYIDGIMCVLLAAAFGWQISYTQRECGKATLSDFEQASEGLDEDASTCAKWRALYVFAVISAALWLVSAAVGFFWVKKHVRTAKPTRTAKPMRTAKPRTRR
ncbi:membrane-associating domain protein [Metarhizium robertsii]|uniref:Integral membrane protein n=2 Tax=Metarhizium robertsii TaxID=568076 RepID=E9ETJ3_METRA|nr:uncharacterized protein MAA_03342 [Metarhizium robertsii ARSEF 23]EFZ00746.1 integral membrane protein [Metarhizium robertsii ARSEF 23]EXV03260.1 membrane-associating domain protein [Metarhizium robertsii]